MDVVHVSQDLYSARPVDLIMDGSYDMISFD